MVYKAALNGIKVQRNTFNSRVKHAKRHQVKKIQTVKSPVSLISWRGSKFYSKTTLGRLFQSPDFSETWSRHTLQTHLTPNKSLKIQKPHLQTSPYTYSNLNKYSLQCWSISTTWWRISSNANILHLCCITGDTFPPRIQTVSVFLKSSNSTRSSTSVSSVSICWLIIKLNHN